MYHESTGKNRGLIIWSIGTPWLRHRKDQHVTQSDEPGVVWMPVPDSIIFPGYNGHTPRYACVHKTASAGTAQDIARFFGNLTENTEQVSSHYIVGDDGTIVQAVSEQNGAGGNCCVEPGHAAFLPTDINLNLISISIEHTDATPENSTPLTSTQKAASFQLIKHICDRHGIPKRPGDTSGGIIGHYQIAPQTRAHCPGSYPWQELFAYLEGGNVTIPTNQHGEIVDVQEADQFQQHRTQFACGYFACAMARSMAKPGDPPTLSIQQVIADGESWYAQYNGNNSITNTAGMTLEQLYSLLAQIGLHFQSTATDIAVVKQWVEAGYPILIAFEEGSAYDMALGRNPYPWTPSGSHIIFVTGVTSDGNVLVRDSANCTNLYDPNSLRPGPRIYKADALSIVSATVAVPPWMPRPTSDIPPTGGNSMTIPTGWHDDGTTLTAPNGHKVIQGFRTHVLNNTWLADNQPLGEEFGMTQLEAGNPQSGAGTEQIFMKTILEWNAAHGVFEMQDVGQELLTTRNQVAAYFQQVAALQRQITDLEAKLQQAGGQALADIQAIKAAFAPVTPILAKY